MKLERIEELKKISTRNLIVRQALNSLEKKYSYNKYELEVSLALVLFSLLGNAEMHKAMDAEDIDWITFVDENYKLIEELKNGEYKTIYEDIFTEIEKGANDKAKYSMTVGSFLEDLGQVFTEENIEKIKVLVEKAIESQKAEE
mgnify:CR=1 FL=1